MKKKFTLLAICLTVAAMLLFACCTKRAPAAAEPTPELVPVATATPEPTAQPTPEPTPEPTAQPEPTATPEPAATGFTNPLTGENVAQDLSAQRPITCMLNNHPKALPQCGISSADIIYEMPEETITRMMAVFAQVPDCDRLGSVRSTRPYHVDVSLSYDAIFVHWGRSNRAATLLANTGIDDIELNESPAYGYAYRDPSHSTGGAEHTGFIKTAKLTQFLADKSWRTAHKAARGYGFTFTGDMKLGGSAANVVVDFAGKPSEFRYDAANGGYQLYQNKGSYRSIANDGLYVDGDTGKAPAFRNVLVLRTTIYNEREIASIVLTDTEDVGYLFCDGKMQEIRWSRGGYDDGFEYFNTDGTPLVMGVGKTYVCIVSHDDDVSYQ